MGVWEKEKVGSSVTAVIHPLALHNDDKFDYPLLCLTSKKEYLSLMANQLSSLLSSILDARIYCCPSPHPCHWDRLNPRLE